MLCSGARILGCRTRRRRGGGGAAAVVGSALMVRWCGGPDEPTRLSLQDTVPRQERGSISIWLVTTGFAMIVLVGLAVDLGGQVHAQQHARAVADQAARTGGQQLRRPVAVRGQGLVADTHLARQAATRLPDRVRADRNGHTSPAAPRSPWTCATPTTPRSWGSSGSPR